jgi:cellulose synthase (UDP-forming)
MEVLGWSIASHIKNRTDIKPTTGSKVAFVTTFVPASESISLLEKTLPAMVNADYGHDTWLLDEGNDPRVKKLCRRYGVKHFSRNGMEHYNSSEGKFAKKTKGGNHNSWYDTFGNNYDFVAQIDTDFIPKKNFLTATLGYFNDPKVAFVGTPQVYGNESDSLIARGAAQQTYNFYGPILRGMDGMQTTLLIGANHVMRVAALKEVDHYSPHITEDLLTGMKLHAAGWKSVYVPKVLAIGEGPMAWKAYFDQQKRWAYGCMHILFTHSPKLLSAMHARRSLYYYVMQQHYFSGIAMGLSAVCLALYFSFGIATTDMDLIPFLAFYVPVLLVMALMSFWLQRFNVRPTKERGILWAGMYIQLAAWPIFMMAFFSLFKRKKLVYKVTPKGKQVSKRQPPTIRLFIPHLVIALLALGGVVSSFFTSFDSPMMIFWGIVTATLMFMVPVLIPLVQSIARLFKAFGQFFVQLNRHYRVFEYKTVDKGLLPTPPTDKEKYLYSKRRVNWLLGFSIVSFIGINISLYKFLIENPIVWFLFGFFFLTIVYFAVSLFVNLFTKDFDIKGHIKQAKNWHPKKYPSVDIFLPTAGESIDVLRNTWTGVQAMVQSYKGVVTVYSLDDSDSPVVKKLAREFKFKYEVRANRGYFKKAGNLRHGYKISSGEFIVIFDADFVPRADFLRELLPYFKNKKVGIVQSPQYFEVSDDQNWLERGAGAVQELFYRFSQVSRQNHNASICVGSNAIYRRAALDHTGGTALIEHSEDVHTGFNLRMHGWTIQYVPVILAKGLCPSSMSAFFKQQYRWCMGSLSLLTSAKFWDAELKPKTRLSYMSGFLYYIHTGLSSFYTPIIPIVLLVMLPGQISILNYVFILPAFVFTQIIYPIWHKSTYGIEAWATRQVYGWAHAFAIWDKITNKHMAWVPTGAKIRKDSRYTTYRFMQIVFNLIPAALWTGLALYYMLNGSLLEYLPIFISGVYFLIISSKVSFYFAREFTVHSPILNHENEKPTAA